jgi:hypothetical protein
MEFGGFSRQSIEPIIVIGKVFKNKDLLCLFRPMSIVLRRWEAAARLSRVFKER